MPLLQFVLRCVTGPLKAAVHRPAYHHVAHHIGRLGRLPMIHRIAAQIPKGFGSACRYVPTAVGIAATALVPPVALPASVVPTIPTPLTSGSGVGDYSWSTGVPAMFGGSDGSDAFGPQDATRQAPFGAAFQSAIDTPAASDDLPPKLALALGSDDTQPIFPGTNSPPGVASVPTTPPVQGVPEPPTFVLLLTVLLGVLFCRRRGRTDSRLGSPAPAAVTCRGAKVPACSADVHGERSGGGGDSQSL